MHLFKQVIDNFAETLKIKSIGSHIKADLVFFENLRLSKTRALQRMTQDDHHTTLQQRNPRTNIKISINACNKRWTHKNNFGRNFPGLRVSQRLLLNTSTPFLQIFRIVGHCLQFSCPRKCNSYNYQPCHLSLIKSNTCQDSKISS